MFDRPKPTAGCSANGRRRRRSVTTKYSKMHKGAKDKFAGSLGENGGG